MKTYVCDRCGKDTFLQRRRFLRTKKSRINIYQMIVTDEGEVSYDLCDECYKKFKKFLSGKED